MTRQMILYYLNLFLDVTMRCYLTCVSMRRVFQLASTATRDTTLGLRTPLRGSEVRLFSCNA